ncbi:MAG: cytochrome c biogenesis protein CcsA [Planctomycetia bacterium]|nr:cytochrome c biogenesis protein CcsA [Planctomycetia bacterium]
MSARRSISRVAAESSVAVLLAAVVVAAALLAPREATMGDAQRIVYLHVPVAWLALLGFLAMAAGGACYLARRDLRFDHAAQAAGEVGWLGCTLTLVTGSLWAHEAWGAWWEWEPRLTSALVLWVISSGILLVRSTIDDPHRKARVAAVLAILGALDVPLVVLATRWFRGMHPVAPELDPSMRAALWISFLGLAALFAWLGECRRNQLRLGQHVAELARRSSALVGM